MREQITDTWMINNKINLKLLDAIDAEGMNCSLSKRGGRTVADQIGHLHNVRLMWLTVCDKSLMNGLIKIEKGNPDKKLLKESLISSAKAIQTLFENAADTGKLKGFKRGVIPMLGYFIAHEAHHRGNILLTLKECGHAVDKQFTYDIWDWGKIG